MTWLDKFRKTKPAEFEQGLGEEHAVLDFEATVTELKKLSPKAQATFLYRLVGALPQKVVQTLSYYVANRLKNGKTPDNRSRQCNTSRN